MSVHGLAFPTHVLPRRLLTLPHPTHCKLKHPSTPLFSRLLVPHLPDDDDEQDTVAPATTVDTSASAALGRSTGVSVDSAGATAVSSTTFAGTGVQAPTIAPHPGLASLYQGAAAMAGAGAGAGGINTSQYMGAVMSPMSLGSSALSQFPQAIAETPAMQAQLQDRSATRSQYRRGVTGSGCPLVVMPLSLRQPAAH